MTDDFEKLRHSEKPWYLPLSNLFPDSPVTIKNRYISILAGIFIQVFLFTIFQPLDDGVTQSGMFYLLPAWFLVWIPLCIHPKTRDAPWLVAASVFIPIIIFFVFAVPFAYYFLDAGHVKS